MSLNEKVQNIRETVEQFLRDEGTTFGTDSWEGEVSIRANTGRNDCVITINIDSSTIGFFVFFNLTVKEEAGPDLAAFLIEANNGLMFSHFCYEKAFRAISCDHITVNRGEITRGELEAYLTDLEMACELYYEELLPFCDLDEDWIPLFIGENGDEEENEEEGDSAWKDLLEKAVSCRRVGKFKESADLLSQILAGTYGITGQERISVKEKLAFAVRFEKIQAGEAEIKTDLNVPSLLQEGVAEGHPGSLVNMALFEIGEGHFEKATELFLKVNSSRKWKGVRLFWEQEVWKGLSHAEGALITWLADMTRGRAGEEDMVAAASVHYEAYVKSDAFRKLRGLLYALAVREMK